MTKGSRKGEMARERIVPLILAACLGLSGCAMDPATTFTAHNAGATLHGVVHGGQNPVTGASIYMFAAGAAAYGAGSTSLLKSSVTTDNPAGGGQDLSGNYYALTSATGSFSFTTADWSGNCPSASSPVYMLAVGGNPGSGANPNLALMAALGPCSGISSSTAVIVNEVTTVASVWALSPFMTAVTNGVPASGINIGADSTNQAGLANAFLTVINNVVNNATGAASGPNLPANATVPVTKINTLANILSSCVNSTGGAAGDGTNCGKLFGATEVNSVAPTTTLAAALNMAQHPGVTSATMTTLFGLQPGVGAPFSGLSSAPNDLTIAINYTGGGLAAPQGIAVDGSGNVWLANTASGSNSVTKLSNLGAVVAGSPFDPSSSLSSPSGIAVDETGNIWVASNGNNSVVKLTSGGALSATYTTGIDAPTGVAVDGSGNLWVANNGNGSVTEISAGGATTNYPGAGAGIASPMAIAISPK